MATNNQARQWMGRVALPWGWWVVLAAPFGLLGGALLRGQALFWGTVSLQFVPWWVAAWDSLRLGVLPFWNPLNGLGAPLIANYQMAFFYPPNWLLLPAAALQGAAGVSWMYTLLAVLHLSWAGLGMAWFLRRWQFPQLAQVCGGLAFGLGGYVVGRLTFLSMAWAYAWVPWVIGYALQVAGSPAWKPASRQINGVPVGLVACLAMQLLAGHAQLTWYTLLLCAAWLTVLAVPQGVKTLLLAWLRFCAAGLASAALAAVQLIPTAQFLLVSQRAGAYDTDGLLYSFWPWRFVTLLLPDFFGSPARGDFWGYVSYWEDHLYPGLLVLLLALATLWLLLRKSARSRTQRWGLLCFAWSMLLVTFVFALGKNTPVYPFLYRYVPTFDMFQAPARYLVWAAVLLPVLGAVGVEHWRCPRGRGLYWLRLATMGTFAVTLGAGLALVLIPNVKATFVRATALGGLWAFCFGVLTLLLPLAERTNRRKIWETGVIACLLFDLLVAGWGLNPTIDRSFYLGSSQVARDFAGGRLFLPGTEEQVLKFERFMRFKDFRPLEDWRNLREVLLPNLNLLDGVASFNNFDPLVTERFSRLYAAVDGMPADLQQSWLAYLGVTAVERVDSTRPFGVRIDTVPDASRLWWYDCARFAPDLDAAWGLLKADFLAAPVKNRAVIIEQTAGDVPSTFCAGSAPALMEIRAERPDEVLIWVETAQPGWLVLADAGYPGWRVLIDEQLAEWQPADVLLRAVYVPEGAHTIRWKFMPVWLAPAAALGILVLFALVFLGRRSRSQSS